MLVDKLTGEFDEYYECNYYKCPNPECCKDIDRKVLTVFEGAKFCPVCGIDLEWKVNIDINQHVYCTDCKWFRLCDEGLPYCPFEGECDINDYEDSRKLLDRPCYKSK